MDVKELEAWLTTDAGKTWADGFKAPLLSKRDELLSNLRTANGSAAQATQRAADAEKMLAEERAAINSILIDRDLGSIMQKGRVMEPCIAAAIAELKETYGIQVKANGSHREAMGVVKSEDGTTREVGLEEIFNEWSKTDSAKRITLASQNRGTGYIRQEGTGAMLPTVHLGSMQGRDLARMSDKDFNAARNSALTGEGV